MTATDDGGQELDRIAVGLEALFPDLHPVAPLRVIGAGFRSLAVETTGGQIFRIARNGDAADGHAAEARLLPYLQGRLPVRVPHPRWRGAPSALFPFGVLGHPSLPGVPLRQERAFGRCGERIAESLAGFLLALHRFPLDQVAALGAPGPIAWEADLVAWRDEILPPLGEALSGRERRGITDWWDRFVDDPSMREYRPVLRHGDLWYENVLVDQGGRSVVGVVDFERASLGDPAQDFATQLHLGEWFVARVIAADVAGGGQLDAGFRHRLRRLWELREFDGVRAAVRERNLEELADAVGKLRRGPILGHLA